ncbi:MAG TPA: porin [Gammaproteobacteria bacterium]|nr:porin [Gammaproteobacteria bacterium]
MKIRIVALLGLLSIGLPVLADPGLKEEVSDLRKENQVLSERVEWLADKLEEDSSVTTQTTSIGGYGELHYNNLDSGEEIDFHRFVLFFGHHFDENIRFHSELEVEHVGTGGSTLGGEVELEQAYIDFHINDHKNVKAGLFLVPVGFLNETHEPPTFFGVERNPVEKNIIPTTWWEAGVAAYGEIVPGLQYDIALTSGLDLSSADKVRSGRQKVSEASAEGKLISTRLQYNGIPGIQLGMSLLYQDDVSQDTAADKVGATLAEIHGAVRKGPFGLRALYAVWDIDDKSNGYDEQSGWYLEPAYYPCEKWGLFVRFNEWDNQAGDSAIDSEIEQVDVGVNYWPHPDVVVKLDYQDQDGASDDDGFNLGVGYQF